MSPPVQQGPLAASRCVGPLALAARLRSSSPPAAAGGRAWTPLARVRAPSVQLVCVREWEVAGLRLRPSPLRLQRSVSRHEPVWYPVGGRHGDLVVAAESPQQ